MKLSTSCFYSKAQLNW